MAYIGAEDVKAIRKELKETFPNVKFSVRKGDGGYSVEVAVVQSKMDFSDIMRTEATAYTQINHFHLGLYGDHTAFFEKVLDVIKTAPTKGEGFHADKGWYDNSDSQVDYFDTAYHINMAVGSWKKPYVKVT